jgi:multiple sugar transport system substrate-binding protein
MGASASFSWMPTRVRRARDQESRRGFSVNRMLRAMAVLVALLLAIAGCGGGGDDDDGGAAGDAKEVTQAKPSGNVTWCIGKDTSGAFGTVVDNFNKANPDATAKLLQLPEAADLQREQQIQRLQAESDECDVLGMDVVWTAEYAAQGWITDITEAVEKRKDEFIPSTVDTAFYEDKYWAMPFNTNAGFMYYRKDEVPQAPTEWEAVYDDAAKKNGLIYQGFRYEGLTVNFLELLYSAGASVVNEDGTEATADSQEVRDVLTFMADGIKSGAVPKAVTTYKEEESRRAFEAGNATYMRNWPYAYALGKESKIGKDLAITTFPGYAGNEGAGVLGGYDLAISAYSKNPEGSLAFINFATSPEQQVIQAEATLPPVVTEVYSDPQVEKAMPFAADLLKAVEQAQPRPVSPVYPQINEAINKNVYAALQGQMSPDEAASTMNEEIQKAIETF